MASESGRDPADLETLREELFEHPERFELEQAVRLLGRLWPDRAPVGGSADPSEEVVRFRSGLSPVFPRADLGEIEPPRDGQPAQLEVCFMGVASPASFGSLPRRFAEEIRFLVRRGNTALRDFLDLFNHRLISLFVRARERHQPAVLFERGPQNPLERALAAVLGLGTRGLSGSLALPDRALFARAGLLAMRPMPAAALEALIESLFEISAAVEQFKPATYRMEREDRNQVGLSSSRLGVDLFVGEEIVLFESRFRVRLGPVGLEQYRELMPDRPGFRQLVDLIRFATRDDLEFDVQVILHADEAPGVRLGSEGSGALGWLSWIGSPPRGRPLQEAVFNPQPCAAHGRAAA